MKRRTILAGAALAALAKPAVAQAWPSRPITLVAGFPPGTSVDQVSRWMADQISRALGQPVVVDNRPGVDGGIAATHVARSRPDGYTLLYTTSSAHGASPSLYRTLTFDPVADFAPITKYSDQAMVLLVRPDDPARTMQDLAARARSSPRPLFYGHGNTSTRVAAELFRYHMNIQLERVPFRANPQAMQELIAGRLDLVFTDVTTGVEQVRQGSLRALAVTSIAHHPFYPGVPSMAEQGIPGLDLVAWGGLVAPAGTPPEIINRFNAVVLQAMASPEGIEFMERRGVIAAPMTPQQFGDYIKAEIARWREYVRIAGIEPQ